MKTDETRRIRQEMRETENGYDRWDDSYKGKTMRERYEDLKADLERYEDAAETEGREALAGIRNHWESLRERMQT